MDERDGSITCGCGCGFVLTPGMYGRLIGGRWFAQGCVGPVRPIQATSADTTRALPYPR